MLNTKHYSHTATFHIESTCTIPYFFTHIIQQALAPFFIFIFHFFDLLLFYRFILELSLSIGGIDFVLKAADF